MVQRLDYQVVTETDLKQVQDTLYQETKDKMKAGNYTGWRNLVPVISSEANIITAIHDLKQNHGSETPGCDGMTIRDILNMHYEEVMETLKGQFINYQPLPVRRVWIPKPGKTDMRPLGIPAVIDRIVQMCIKNILEPIMEAQFFQHSYGFRPMRSAAHALERLSDVVHKTGYTWVIEGDIKGFFDNVNHPILLKQLWHMGIRDRRVLMMVKQMLKAGIMGEIRKNPLGTPQGGIISPLLANVYLHKLDQWITREWENKKLRNKSSMTSRGARSETLRFKTNLKPAYLIRYADDWILVTDSLENARKWKHRIGKYLNTNLKLTLSEDKTLITNTMKKSVKFLGFEFNTLKGKSRKGIITRSRPDRKRLKMKVADIKRAIRKLEHHTQYPSVLIREINRVNSQIRGIINYYRCSTWANIELSKYDWIIRSAARCALKKCGSNVVRRIPANRVSNLPIVHGEHKAKLTAYKYEGKWFAITSIAFCRWEKVTLKNQRETPFTKEGRNLFHTRTKRSTSLLRLDEMFNNKSIELWAKGIKKGKYNFEFVMNRAYALNRDRGKCKVCGQPVWVGDVETHHNSPKLPLKLANKVQHLSTVHLRCHDMIHNNVDYSHLGKKVWGKIQNLREKLNFTN